MLTPPTLLPCRKNLLAPVSLLLASMSGILLGGCGSASYSGRAALANATSPHTVSGGDTNGASTDASDSESDADKHRTGISPHSRTISGAGYDTPVTLTVSANRILKVRFSPGIQDRNQPGSGYFWPYSVLAVFIEVGGKTKDTSLLYNGYGSPQGTEAGETSAIIDFSSSIPKTCSESNPTCREQVTITIKHPNSDDVCINSGAYCPRGYAHVPADHPWNGTLLIETDDTDKL